MSTDFTGLPKIQWGAAVLGGIWAGISDVNTLAAILSVVVVVYTLAEKIGWLNGSKNRISKTVVAVIVFLIVLVTSAFSEKTEASPYIDVGKTVNHSSITTGGVGFRFYDKWDLQVRSIGVGETKNGFQDQQFNYSVSRVFSPDWTLFGASVKTGMGGVYSPDLELVGPYNYRLRLILNWKNTVEIEAFHDSSAGTFDPNTGIDALAVRLFL